MATLADMAAFVAVMEHRSFSKAGRELRVSTAVVSARVAHLEKQIGVRLFNRTTRQVVPTEEAKPYFEDCKKILHQVEDAEAALSSRKENPSGDLKLTAPLVFGERYVAPLLPEFQKIYPDLRVRFHLSDSITDLLSSGMDMAIRIASLPDSTLVAKKLADSPRVLCAAPDYLDHAGIPQKLDDLLEHNCLLLRFPGSTQFQWHFNTGDGTRSLPVSGALDSDNGNVLRQWALAGHGIALKSRWEVEDDLNTGRLAIVLEQIPPLPVSISALYPQGRIVPPKVRVLLNYLGQAFKSWNP